MIMMMLCFCSGAALQLLQNGESAETDLLFISTRVLQKPEVNPE